MAETEQGQKQEGAQLWEKTKAFFASGFGKGLLITVGVVLLGFGLVTGAMGAGQLDSLKIDGVTMRTFGDAAAKAIGEVAKFFTTPIGLTTLAGGGLIGAFSEMKNRNAAAAAPVPAPVVPAQSPELAQTLEPQPQLQPAVAQNVPVAPTLQPAVQPVPQQEMAQTPAQQQVAQEAPPPLVPATQQQATDMGAIQDRYQPLAQQPVATQDTVSQPTGKAADDIFSEGYIAGIRAAQEAAAREHQPTLVASDNAPNTAYPGALEPAVYQGGSQPVAQQPAASNADLSAAVQRAYMEGFSAGAEQSVPQAAQPALPDASVPAANNNQPVPVAAPVTGNTDQDKMAAAYLEGMRAAMAQQQSDRPAAEGREETPSKSAEAQLDPQLVNAIYNKGLTDGAALVQRTGASAEPAGDPSQPVDMPPVVHVHNIINSDPKAISAAGALSSADTQSDINNSPTQIAASGAMAQSNNANDINNSPTQIAAAGAEAAAHHAGRHHKAHAQGASFADQVLQRRDAAAAMSGERLV